MRASRRLAAPLLAALMLSAPSSAEAEPTDVAVKAAFLPRFGRYVEWPPQLRPARSGGMVLCLIGTDPFGALVEQASRSQSIDGQPVVIRRADSPAKLSGCHVAYVRGTATVPTGQMLAALADKPVLTVTDTASSGQRGIIHFQVVAGRVRFVIDNGAARRKGLVLSSRLLALATDVRNQ